MKLVPLIAVLAGCAGPAFAQPAQDAIVKCDAPRECEIAWATAQDAVSLISDMRTRLATDTRLETFAPTTMSRIGAVLTKSPAGASGYEIRLRIECFRDVDCADMQTSAENVLRTMVAAKLRAAATPQDGAAARIARMPDVLACSTKPTAVLVGKSGDRTTYTVPCSNGDALAIVCDENACRALK